ncbi:insulinase family protein [Cyanobium sp. BA20m-p-22]|uniref:M16 family metallopeptidase n=1 Tax=Cyanobium sp. BA20m-p-22 TaxID=2823704 RepID=UPI0020CE26A8|nr:pitrilysin family protein [Cyanobium sp. BA20m-p-22]MCP9909523.1 insulinase family protein [Cyanobium sp. BA20m-p-22]
MTSAPTAPKLPGLAEPTELQLANGATLVQLPLADSPLVCLDFWCRAGSIFEKAPESGLAHFLEHMVFKGSQRLGPGEFDLKIEAMGGSSNAATGFDDVHYHVLVPPESAAQALELLLDLVLHPSLEPRAFAMERQVVLEELAQSEDQPDEIALQQLLRLGCPGHAYGEPILGRRELLAAQTPEAMADFHRRLYGANRCVLALCGGADFLQLKEGIDASALAQLGAIDEPATPPALVVQPGLHRLTVPRLESARLLMLWGLPPASDLHGVMGADLLTTVLAEGRRSRLVERLREQLRIVESIDLDLHVMESGSFALLEAICEADELGAVHRAIAQVWAELQEQGLTKPEWLRAQRLVANGYRFGLEAAGGLAGLIGNNRLWGRHQALALPLAEIENWSSQELLSQAVPLLDPSRACVLEAVPA